MAEPNLLEHDGRRARRIRLDKLSDSFDELPVVCSPSAIFSFLKSQGSPSVRSVSERGVGKLIFLNA